MTSIIFSNLILCDLCQSWLGMIEYAKKNDASITLEFAKQKFFDHLINHGYLKPEIEELFEAILK